MRFYDGQHRFYCGVDLHTKRMYLCILDHEGNKRLHRNVRAKPRELSSCVWPPVAACGPVKLPSCKWVMFTCRCLART